MTDRNPKEIALAVFDSFLTAFTAAVVDAVVGLFWPDALFWGTTKPDLATTAKAVREYFKPVGNLKPNEWRAASLGTSTLAVSDSVVLISGFVADRECCRWQADTPTSKHRCDPTW